MSHERAPASRFLAHFIFLRAPLRPWMVPSSLIWALWDLKLALEDPALTPGACKLFTFIECRQWNVAVLDRIENGPHDREGWTSPLSSPLAVPLLLTRASLSQCYIMLAVFAKCSGIVHLAENDVKTSTSLRQMTPSDIICKPYYRIIHVASCRLCFHMYDK